jgi:hypothetical protein
MDGYSSTTGNFFPKRSPQLSLSYHPLKVPSLTSSDTRDEHEGASVILTAPISSFLEVVEDEVFGILCEHNNIGQFVAACEKLADSTQILRMLGNAAHERFEKLFSVAVVYCNTFRFTIRPICISEEIKGGCLGAQRTTNH